MFTYKIIKHEDEENGTLYALYEVTTADDGETMVMGQTPVNGVFYESIDELSEHINELNNYVTKVQAGEEEVADAEDVTFVDMQHDCGDEDCEDCGDDCECGGNCACDDKKGFHSFQEGNEMKKGGCCGGNCGCHD